jgi:ABC-type multidrug transport system fused ATPase/permease subunit
MKPVIILGQVTPSLDTATESVIHRIIDNEFTKKCHTAIHVTHRINATPNLIEWIRVDRNDVRVGLVA